MRVGDDVPRILFTCAKFDRWQPLSPPLIPRGHELPLYIVTFDGLTLEYGFLGL